MIVYYDDQSDPSESARRARRRGSVRNRTTDTAASSQPTNRKRRRKRMSPPVQWVFVLVVIGLVLCSIGAIAHQPLTNGWCYNIWYPHLYGPFLSFQADIDVGHTSHGKKGPSHFLAFNYNGQIDIIEWVAGDLTNAHMYTTWIYGQNATKTPVVLDFRDINSDGKLDMVPEAQFAPGDIGTVPTAFINKDNGFISAV